MKTLLRYITASGLVMLLAVHPAVGKEANFPKTVESENHDLTLVGTGLLRYKRIIPVYDAALYLGKNVLPDQALQDTPKRIEVVYRVNAEAARFHKAGENVLQDNFSPEEIAAIRERLDRINGWYPDANKGDRCAIQYIPGMGTELIYNSKSLGVIPGADFAKLYFSIWLGEEPASKNLREDLLQLN